MKKGQLASAFVWEGFARIGAEAVTFLLQLVLARLLTPDDFGVIAVLMLFIALEGVFIESGFRSSLVQKKDLADIDCQSVFWLQLSIGICLYALLWFLSPFIAGYYEKPVLSPLLRVLALTPLINSLTMVHMAKLLREMKFKQKLPILWGGILAGGITGIGMACAKCGVWALVGQQLAQAVASGAVTLCFIRWTPRFAINFRALIQLFRFGGFLLGNSLISTGVSSFFRFIVSSFFSLATLGLYNMGNGIPRMAMSSLNMTIINVLFPAFSNIQDSKEKLKASAASTQNMVNFLVFPMLFCLIAVASPLVQFFLGEKWMGCVPMLRITSLGYLFWPSHLINLQICNSLGHSRTSFFIELLKSAFLIAMVFVCCRFGILCMCWGFVVYSAFSFILNALPSGIFIHYGPFAQFCGLLKKLLIAGLSALGSFSLYERVSSFPVIRLASGIVLYALFYLLLTLLCNRRELVALWQVVCGLLRPKKGKL